MFETSCLSLGGVDLVASATTRVRDEMHLRCSSQTKPLQHLQEQGHSTQYSRTMRYGWKTMVRLRRR